MLNSQFDARPPPRLEFNSVPDPGAALRLCHIGDCLVMWDTHKPQKSTDKWSILGASSLDDLRKIPEIRWTSGNAQNHRISGVECGFAGSSREISRKTLNLLDQTSIVLHNWVLNFPLTY